jgi:hypothetical protein
MPNAIRFGRSGAGDLSRTINLPPSTGFTAMGWFRVPTLAGWMSCIQLSGVGSFYQMGVEGTTGLNEFEINTAAAQWPGSALVSGLWYHMCMTASGTSGANTFGYLNGVLNLTATSVSFTSNKLWLGNSTGGDPLNGQGAAIKIWDRVLDAAEINAELPYAMPVSWAGLNSAYPLPSMWDLASSGVVVPRGALTRWADVSGNNVEWTQNGTLDTDLGPPIQFAPSPQQRRSRIANSAAPPTGGTPDLYYRMMRSA